MKLIIDIDEEAKNELFDIANNGKDIVLSLQNMMIMAIVNGTPLEEKPKKHIQRTDCACYDEEYCELYDCGEYGIIDEMEGEDDEYF